MKNRTPYRIGMVFMLAASMGGHLHAQTITKADNTDDLNLGTSWVGGTAPGTGNVALWDSTVTAANSVSLGADATWGGIRVDSPGGLVTIGGANTLTLEGSGINMGSSVGEDLEIDSALALSANQTWSLGVTRSITVDGDLALGANTLNTNVAGTITLNGVISGSASGNALFISNNFAGGRVKLTNASNSFTGTIEFSNTSSQILEYASAGALGATTQIRFRNTGGSIGNGSVLLYTGTTDETVTQQLQCDTSIGMRLQSDSVGGSVTFNGGFLQTNRNLYLEGTGTGDNTLASVFAGTGALTKSGTGTWVLTGSNSYSGGTTIGAGTLRLGAPGGGGTGNG
ncbi:MAG: autotransporter-associated beta strand repeat-containing protein, partial [Luteolibacter sp.]